MEKKRGVHKVCGEKERDHLQDLYIEGKKILEWILKTCIGMAWAGLIWHKIWGNLREVFEPVMNVRIP